MKILILSTADWDHPVWTNKQHVAVTLAKLGHHIVYIDSLGLRKMQKSSKDKRRILKRIKNIFSTPRKVRERIWIVSPLVLPGIQTGMLAWANKISLRLTVYYTYLRLGFQCNILWTYSPATTLYFKPSKFEHSIYHCVDDIGSQPNMPSRVLKELERETALSVDHVVVTTNNLLSRMKGLNKSLHLMPNVVEYKKFAYPSSFSLEKAASLMESIPRPIIGFVGAISTYKLDFDLLLTVVDSHKEYSFVLCGPIGEGEPQTNISELIKRKNIYFLGPQSYEIIPGLMCQFDVGILPSKRNEYTKSMFPMKFFEYLASGIPVVSIDIPSLIKYKSIVKLCKNAEEFSAGICREVKFGNEPKLKAMRQALASENTYRDRTKKMLELIRR